MQTLQFSVLMEANSHKAMKCIRQLQTTTIFLLVTTQLLFLTYILEIYTGNLYKLNSMASEVRVIRIVSEAKYRGR